MHFSNVGLVHAPASVGHISFFVNVTLYVESCRRLNIDHGNRDGVAPLMYLCERLEALPREHSGVLDDTHAREKRQAALLIGSLFGGFMLSQLLMPRKDTALVHRVNVLDGKMMQLARHVEGYEHAIHNWASLVEGELFTNAFDAFYFQNRAGLRTGGLGGRGLNPREE